MLAADEREKTTYFHHWLYFFTWFNTEFEPHLLEFSLFSFFFTQTLFFFKTYQCNAKFMWCSYKFFLEPKKRHSSMCSRMVGLLIRTEKPNSGPKQHCCLPTPLSRTIQNIAVVATCGHCGPTYQNIVQKIGWNLNLLRIIWLISKRCPWASTE